MSRSSLLGADQCDFSSARPQSTASSRTTLLPRSFEPGFCGFGARGGCILDQRQGLLSFVGILVVRMLPNEAPQIEHAHEILVVRSFLVEGLRLIEVALSRFAVLIEQTSFVERAEVVTCSPFARPFRSPPSVRGLAIELKSRSLVLRRNRFAATPFTQHNFGMRLRPAGPIPLGSRLPPLARPHCGAFWYLRRERLHGNRRQPPYFQPWRRL